MAGSVSVVHPILYAFLLFLGDSILAPCLRLAIALPSIAVGITFVRDLWFVRMPKYWPVVRAAMCSGLYPNLVRVDYGKKKFKVSLQFAVYTLHYKYRLPTATATAAAAAAAVCEVVGCWCGGVSFLPCLATKNGAPVGMQYHHCWWSA